MLDILKQSISETFGVQQTEPKSAMTELVDSLEQSAKELDAAVNQFIKRKV